MCFNKASRLQHRHEFDAVFCHGQKITVGFLTILLKPNDLDRSRIGLVIAKRYVHMAVKRNRLKRLIREVFRQMKSQFGSYDLIVLVNKAIVKHDDLSWASIVFQAMTKTRQSLPGVNSI